MNERTWVRYICHQRPERCFKINGKPMAICARCTGFYSGLLFGIIIPIIFTGIYFIDINLILLMMLVGILPLAIDGGTQFLGIRKSNNYLRLATGLLCGLFLGILFNWLITHILFLD